MPQLVIADVDDAVIQRLEMQAAAHGRTVDAEANAILTQALEPSVSSSWEAVDALRNKLSASGRDFSDSAELVREDRDQ